MVKYLNNRKDKSRANRQQNPRGGQQAGQGQAGGPRGPQQNGSGEPLAQDHPAARLMQRTWNLFKSLLTYHPSEEDDTFSLGDRRTKANPGVYQLNPQDTQTGQGQGAEAASNQGTTQSGTANKRTQQPQPDESPQNFSTTFSAQGNQCQQGQSLGRPGQPRGQDQGQQGQAGGQSQGHPGSGQTGQTPGGGNQSGGVSVQPNTAPYFELNPPGDISAAQKVKHTQQGGTPLGEKPVPVEEQIHYALEKNLEHIKLVFHLPDNKGFTVREFTINLAYPCRAFIVFTEGLADKNIIDNFILNPLMVLSGLEQYRPKDPMALVKERLVTTNQVEEKRSFRDVIDSVLMGSTAIFVDGSNAALLVETKGWEHRPIGQPLVENVVRGPQEGFNEVLISNIALVRSRLRTENLVSEMFKVGNLSKADVAVLYLRDLANPTVVEEVRRRIKSLNVDYVPDTGMLEQFIEDDPMSPMPQMLSTERPDRVAAYLAEGHVAIVMSSTPFALIVPVTFWALLHSAEDSYIRWPYGGLMRIVRISAVFIGMLLDAFYIAIVNYHSSAVPQDLLYAIAASREQVPFPSVIEILVMELSFELIREAGIRIPSVIGPTIGIVGALILGQAAVQARLISPIVIIIVSLTGLSSFAIPNYNLSFQIRIMRFVYIIAAAVGGFFTMAATMVVHMAVLSTTNSFGVPILSPAAPNRPSKDTLLRAPLWVHEARPSMLRPLRKRRQPPVARSWDPQSIEDRGGQNG